jgi:hypothetical protein
MAEPTVAQLNVRGGEFHKLTPQPKVKPDPAPHVADNKSPASLSLSSFPTHDAPVIKDAHRTGAVVDLTDLRQPTQTLTGVTAHTTGRPSTTR